MADSPKTDSDTVQPNLTPGRCWTGSLTASGLGFATYLLTQAIARSFAAKPPTGNDLALQIAATVRTLVLGLSVMVTGFLALISVGLILLGFQILLKKETPDSAEEG